MSIYGTKNYQTTYSDPVSFTISPREVKLTVTASDGVYGSAAIPVVTLGDELARAYLTITYTGKSNDDTFAAGATAPVAAGSYTVTAAIGSANFVLSSDSVTVASYTIAKQSVAAPEMGEQSFVFGGDLKKNEVVGYNEVLAEVTFAGELLNENGKLFAAATNAGEYVLTFTLRDSDNYTWTNEEGAAITLTWSIGKLVLNRPAADESEFISGSNLTYQPVGFDEIWMTISGNEANKAGEYTVTVSLKDATNCEWADGTTADITYNWVVRNDLIPVYIVLGVGGGILILGIAVLVTQMVIRKRRKV